jgi:hypothetical protein
MKLSFFSLIALATPLAACIVRPPEDCSHCDDPSCPPSTSYTPPTNSYGPPPPMPTPDGATATAATAGKRDAGAALPEADGGAVVPRPDARAADGGTTSVSDGGSPSDLKVEPPCTDAGICGKPVVPLCTWNHECGNGGRCADGECQRPCTTSSTCGTGATCQAGFCQPGGSPGGQCLYATDCSAGSLCINGFCHAGCKADVDCPNRADACTGNVCQPDGRPTPQCRSNLDCAADRECVNATCRTLCASDENCGPACSGTLCREGYCVEPQESAPQCSRNAACGAGHACIDAVCV